MIKTISTLLTLALLVSTAQAGEVENNTFWQDTDGVGIYANGGSMIKENDIWYWVGHSLTPWNQDIHFDTVMYSNDDFGSDGWDNVGTKIDAPLKENGQARSYGRPSILKNSDGRFIIGIKKSGALGIWISDTTDIEGSYSYLQEWLPADGWTVQDMSLSKLEGNGYMTVHLRKGPEGNRENKIALYKLSSDFTDVSTLLWEVESGLEAPSLWKANGGKYYITASQKNGWGASETKYYQADTITDISANFVWGGYTAGDDTQYFPFLNDGNEVRRQNGMTVTKGRQVSYMSQHDFIQWIDGQLVYSGDRFPMFDKYIDNSVWGGGRNLLLPVTFEGDRPKIKWAKTWELSNSSYDITDTSW